MGKATFARLNDLEPGAVYAVAESKACDTVVTAMVSDRSKPGKAVWFVDCANDNRFMIEQRQAEAALARFETKALADTDLEASCTIDNVAMCKVSTAQKTAMKQEVMHVSACDIILQEMLVNHSSLSMRGAWKTEFSGDDTIIFRRAFDSENSFGARIRSQYRCDVNAVTHNISRFEIRGPFGTKRLI